jgi:hypothetical protein
MLLVLLYSLVTLAAGVLNAVISGRSWIEAEYRRGNIRRRAIIGAIASAASFFACISIVWAGLSVLLGRSERVQIFNSDYAITGVFLLYALYNLVLNHRERFQADDADRAALENKRISYRGRRGLPGILGKMKDDLLDRTEWINSVVVADLVMRILFAFEIITGVIFTYWIIIACAGSGRSRAATTTS